MGIQTSTKSGIVIHMFREAGLTAPDPDTATALFAEAQRLAGELGLKEAYHFLAIAVELAREEPYGEVLRRMQSLTLSE